MSRTVAPLRYDGENSSRVMRKNVSSCADQVSGTVSLAVVAVEAAAVAVAETCIVGSWSVAPADPATTTTLGPRVHAADRAHRTVSGAGPTSDCGLRVMASGWPPRW